MKKLRRPAFTLFEIMIVVLIIGVVYSLVLGTFDPKKSVKVITLEHIKDALSPHWEKGKRVDFYIYNRCQKSALLVNGELQEELNIDISLDIFKDIKVYKNDIHSSEREIEFAPVLIDEKLYKVCFQYTIFPNSSASSYVVKSGDRYYAFFPYFRDTYITSKLRDALDMQRSEEFTKIRVVDE